MNLREESKKNWTGDGSAKSINTGSLQRIADASEIMAQNHAALINERDRLSQTCNRGFARIEWLERSNAALRGVITKLKKKLESS